MERKIHTLNPEGAPQPIGPYSVAKVYSGVGYVSGQVPIIPATGEVLSSTVEEETELVLNNIGAILKAMNCDYSHVLKCTVFLTDMKDFPKVNEVYGRFFKDSPPARCCIAVAELPKKCRVQIDATVAVGDRLK